MAAIDLESHQQLPSISVSNSSGVAVGSTISMKSILNFKTFKELLKKAEERDRMELETAANGGIPVQPKKKSLPENFLAKKGTRNPPVPFAMAELKNTDPRQYEKIMKEYDQTLSSYLIQDSIVQCGKTVTFSDNITGLPCSRYYLSLPTSQTIIAYGEKYNADIERKKNNNNNNENNNNNNNQSSSQTTTKKQQQSSSIALEESSSHNIARTPAGYVGHFSSLDHLKMFLVCVCGISHESPLIKDILRFYNIKPTHEFGDIKALEARYQSILLSRQCGGDKTTQVSNQNGAPPSYCRGLGCFFYGKEGESSKRFNVIDMEPFRVKHKIPGELHFPYYDDFASSLLMKENQKKEAEKAEETWINLIRETGADVALKVYEQLKSQSKKRKLNNDGSSSSSSFQDDGKRIVYFNQGQCFIIKEDEEKGVLASSSDVLEGQEEGFVICETKSQQQDENQVRRKEEEDLFEKLIEELKRDLEYDINSNTGIDNLSEEPNWVHVIESVDWQGEDNTSDVSKDYKKTVKKIHKEIKQEKRQQQQKSIEDEIKELFY